MKKEYEILNDFHKDILWNTDATIAIVSLGFYYLFKKIDYTSAEYLFLIFASLFALHMMLTNHTHIFDLIKHKGGKLNGRRKERRSKS